MFHIQPYHMNGLNWRIAPQGAEVGNVVVVTGFMPNWWTQEYGMTFGTRFHLDSEVHKKTICRMEELSQERFGDLPGFSPETGYQDSYVCERRYGDALIPALFGCAVDFEDASGHPYAACLNLSDEQASRLTIPDLENSEILRELLDPVKGGYTQAVGEIGNEGVINIAYKLRGEALFLDVIANPDLFDRICEVVCETMTKVMHMVREWQNPRRPTFIVNCDCLINLMSGEMYKQRLLIYEKLLSSRFDVFGIHTCNWTVDPYLPALEEISARIDYLDMGENSDFDLIHRMFPDLRPTVFYHQEKVRHLDQSTIRKEIGELCRRIKKGYILLCDLEAGTKDENIRAVYEVAAGF